MSCPVLTVCLPFNDVSDLVEKAQLVMTHIDREHAGYGYVTSFLSWLSPSHATATVSLKTRSYAGSDLEPNRQR